MNDSETKIEEKEGEKPSVSEEIVLRRNEPLKVIRGKGGKFQKQPKTMPKTADVTRLLRNLLNQPVANADGKLMKGGITRLKKMFDNIYEIATTNPNQPVLDKFGNPVMRTDEDGKAVPITVMDAKVAMASVQAWKELMLRAHGMPSKSDEEVEALKTQQVKIVILQHPEMMDKTVVEDAPKPSPSQPAFIDAEIVENK